MMRAKASNHPIAPVVWRRHAACHSIPLPSRPRPHTISEAASLSKSALVALTRPQTTLSSCSSSLICSQPLPAQHRRLLPRKNGGKSAEPTRQYSSAASPSEAPRTSDSATIPQHLEMMHTFCASATAIPHNVASFAEVEYASAEYHLSPEDFDLEGECREESFDWPTGLNTVKLPAVVSLFDCILRLDPDDGQLEEALHLSLFAVLVEAPSSSKADRCLELLSKAREVSYLQRTSRESIQLVVNGLRRDDNHHAAAHVLKTWLDNPPSLSRADMQIPLLQLSLFVIQSTKKEQRLLALRAIQETMESDIALCTTLVAGLVAGLSRGGLNWADCQVACTLANELEKRLMLTSLSQPLSDDMQFCWVALTVWRALAKTSDANGAQRNRHELLYWVKDLDARGLLQGKRMRSAIHSVVLRAHPIELHTCETEEDVKALISWVTESCGGVPPGRSSYGWGIRSLLGYDSSLLRISDEDSSTRTDVGLRRERNLSSSSLVGVHEADLLLDSFLALPRAPKPTPFLVSPHMKALLAQFPPSIDRAMAIYRLMRAGARRSHGLAKYLSIFSTLRRRDSVTIPLPGARRAAQGPDQATLALLLNHLLDTDPLDLAEAREILNDTIDDQKELVLDPMSRVKYTHRLLYAVESVGEDAPAALDTLMKSGRWTLDWQNYHWQSLVARLAGLEGTSASSDSLNEPLLVKGSVLVAVVKQSLRRKASLGLRLHTTLLHKLGHLATLGPRKDAKVFANLVRDLHTLLIRDEQMDVDMPLLNALMNAYNRCKAPSSVHELWDGLVLAAANSDVPRSGESGTSAITLANTSVTEPSFTHSSTAAAIDGATLSIYLDTCGRFVGGEGRGRRAWAFTSYLDAQKSKMAAAAESEKAIPMRNQNAWTSWLEFLCRKGHLSEAIDQLSSMTAELKVTCGPEIGPDVKTLEMLLRFAARERDVQAERSRKDPSGEFFDGNLPDAREDPWTQLREIIRTSSTLRRFWGRIEHVGRYSEGKDGDGADDRDSHRQTVYMNE